MIKLIATKHSYTHAQTIMPPGNSGTGKHHYHHHIKILNNNKYTTWKIDIKWEKEKEKEKEREREREKWIGIWQHYKILDCAWSTSELSNFL